MLDRSKIAEEIKAGLPNERDRMATAYDNRRFYEGHFEEYPTKIRGGSHTRIDFRRTSRIMGRIVDTLCGYLYRRQPSRRVPGDTKATEILARIYRQNAMPARWGTVDKMATVGDFTALQFAGGTDPAAPAKIHLRDADQVAVWLDPDDATQAGAVAVVETVDNQRRLQLWTPDKVSYWATTKSNPGVPGQQAGGTAYSFLRDADNPYRDADGMGILPFSFAHFNFPATHFFSGGVGSHLREVNDHINYKLDSLHDAIRYLNRPIAIASGVGPGWTPPRQVEPGTWVNLDADSAGMDANGNGPVPSLSYLVSDTAYVSVEWEDINNYLDHTLEMNNVPPGSIRFAEVAQSGVALVIRQGPLISWAENRRLPFSYYEERSAITALQVAASHLENNGQDGGRLWDAVEAIKADGLSLAWPRMSVLPPGPERDASDQFEVEQGYTSKVQVVMSRFDCSREQALEHLDQVAKDNAELETLGIDPGSTPFQPPPPPGEPPPPNGNGPPGEPPPQPL